jgi:uncharacterized membrane protein YhaH (DUF805 family)
MDRMLGRKIFSRGPMASLHFWLGTLFVVIASVPAVLVMVRHGDRVSSEAFQWLLLGIAAVWLFWIRVGMAHARLHQYIMRGGSAVEDTDFVLEQAFQLAYVGLSLVGFATLGLLLALSHLVGTR